MSSTKRVPLCDLPPSAKLVYKTLEYTDEDLTQKQLTEKSRLSARTVRYALERLERTGAVESELNLADARQRFYTLSRHSPFAPEQIGIDTGLSQAHLLIGE